mgnify:CR=1 FL=1
MGLNLQVVSDLLVCAFEEPVAPPQPSRPVFPPRSITMSPEVGLFVKELKKKGLLSGLDESEEINACSIKVSIVVDDISLQLALLQDQFDFHMSYILLQPH